ncbi:MAG: dihydroorotase [Candidatus Altiarchaeota archaeon]
MYDLIIKNARILLFGNIFKGAIAVKNGKISRIARNFSDNSAKVIDAKENFLLPGAIDVHVHFRDFEEKHKEDWFTGSKAAAAGGVTTVLDMPNNKPPITNIKNLEKKRKLAAKRSIVDFGFHFAATSENLESIKKVKNVASVKFYMGTTTNDLLIREAEIFEYFKILAKKKIPATIHCEDEQMLQYYKEKILKFQKDDAIAYADSRPNICASSAMNKIIYFSKFSKTKVHFCHVSTSEEIDLLRRHPFFWLSAEATPHHLFLTRKDLKKLGTFAKMNPPLRSEKDREELWDAINKNLIKIIATDHAPHLKEEKSKGIWDAPAGVPGVETMLPLLLNEVSKGNLSLQKLVKLIAENPAKVFSIRGKGKIQEGYDADLLIVDMKIKRKINAEKLFTKCKWSPFEGLTVKGMVIKTFIRGNLVFDNGETLKNSGKEVKFMKK